MVLQFCYAYPNLTHPKLIVEAGNDEYSFTLFDNNSKKLRPFVLTKKIVLNYSDESNLSVEQSVAVEKFRDHLREQTKSSAHILPGCT